MIIDIYAIEEVPTDLQITQTLEKTIVSGVGDTLDIFAPRFYIIKNFIHKKKGIIAASIYKLPGVKKYNIRKSQWYDGYASPLYLIEATPSEIAKLKLKL